MTVTMTSLMIFILSQLHFSNYTTLVDASSNGYDQQYRYLFLIPGLLNVDVSENDKIEHVQGKYFKEILSGNCSQLNLH